MVVLHKNLVSFGKMGHHKTRKTKKTNIIRIYLPLVSREWKNGSNSSYNCTPFLHSLLAKGKYRERARGVSFPRSKASDPLALHTTHRPHSSSFLGLPYTILHMNPEQELLWGLWVHSHKHAGNYAYHWKRLHTSRSYMLQSKYVQSSRRTRQV